MFARLFRRRRSGASFVGVAVPAQAVRAGAWATAALPPAQPVGTPYDSAPIAGPATAQAPAVRLGFGDGSEVVLDATSPHAVALRAVAEALVQAPTADADK